MKSLLLIVLAGLVAFGGCLKHTDESIIRDRLAEFDRIYESKQFGQLERFYHPKYLEDGGWGRKPGWFAKWKTNQEHLYSAYPRLQIHRTIISVDRVGFAYIVQEVFSLDGIDSAGRTEPIRESARHQLTFVREGDDWFISQQLMTRVSPFYDSLSEKYDGIGRIGLAYVCQTSLDFVSVIDPVLRKVIGVIPCGIGPTSLAFAEGSHRGYITNFRSGTITVFDKNTNERITDIRVGLKPAHVVVDPEERYIYVGHQSVDGIWVISAKTNEVFRRIPMINGAMRWNTLAEKLFVSNMFDSTLVIIDPANSFQTTTIAVGGRPMELAFSADEKFLYLTNFWLNEVQKIDVSSGTIVNHIGPVYNPRGICVDPDGKFAYVTNVLSQKLTIIDLAKDEVIDSVDIGRAPTGVSYGCATRTLFVSNQSAYRITEFDPVSRSIRDTIDVADNPIDVMVDNGKSGIKF